MSEVLGRMPEKVTRDTQPAGTKDVSRGPLPERTKEDVRANIEKQLANRERIMPDGSKVRVPFVSPGTPVGQEAAAPVAQPQEAASAGAVGDAPVLLAYEPLGEQKPAQQEPAQQEPVQEAEEPAVEAEQEDASGAQPPFTVCVTIPGLGKVEEDYDLFVPFAPETDDAARLPVFMLGRSSTIVRRRKYTPECGVVLDVTVGSDCSNPVHYARVRRIPYLGESGQLGYELYLFFGVAAEEGEEEGVE